LLLAALGLVAGWLVFTVSLLRSGSDGEGGRHEDPEGVPEVGADGQPADEVVGADSW
jgi:hypothetical protein